MQIKKLSYFFFTMVVLAAPAVGLEAFEPSGTLPVVYVNTEESRPIEDKVNYVQAEMWITVPEGCKDKAYVLGDEDHPVKLQIKGRGNSSWLNDKKPYKLKLDKKTSVLGMPKHKHFALLANANSFTDWMSQAMGKELARIVDLGWTPGYEPVELVLNNEFLGLYFLNESIKIGENRLDIFEQEDENDEPDDVPFGWLVEIDNYADDCQILVRDDVAHMRVTYKSPEVLSDLQRAWLTYEFNALTAVLRSDNPERWVDYIDPVSLARYFIVREVMADPDGFNGSTYMYRDAEEHPVWRLGPMWDNAFNAWSEPTDWTMYQLPEWSRWKLMPTIFTTKAFQDAFREEWDAFYPRLEEVGTKMMDLAKRCKDADCIDARLWGLPHCVSEEQVEKMYRCLVRRAEWIEDHKDLSRPDDTGGVDDPSPEGDDDNGDCQLYDLQGRKLAHDCAPGIYVRVGKSGSATAIRHKP